MDDRELRDIMIGGDDVRASQSKKLILLIVGIVVLILACVLIVISISGGNEEQPAVVSDVEAVGPAASGASGLNVGSSDDDFETIVNEIRARGGLQGGSQSVVPETPAITQEPSKATMPERKPQPAQRATSNSASSRPVVVQTPRQATYRGNNGDIAESGYYLQVGAFSKTPNAAFLDSINRYSYRIQEIMINSKVITRYLIGPYPSRDAAQRDYANVARDVATPVYLQVD